MSERPSLSLGVNFALVLLVEAVVIGLLWFAGRYFGMAG